MGTSSISMFLAPILEMFMTNVAVCMGDYYQGLLGCNVLCRHNEVVGLATSALPRPD